MIESEEEKKTNRESWSIMRKPEEMRNMKFKVVFPSSSFFKSIDNQALCTFMCHE